MKEYTINYRAKGNKEGQVYETSLTADSIKEARKEARLDLDSTYTIVSVKLS